METYRYNREQRCSGLAKDLGLNNIQDILSNPLESSDTLSHNVDDYRNIMLAGQLMLKHIYDTGPKSIEDYILKMGHRLNGNTRAFMAKHSAKINALLAVYSHSTSSMDSMAALVLYHSYLSSPRYKEPIYETPEILRLRVAIQMYYMDGFEAVLKAFGELANGYIMAASPTMFNAGMQEHQMSSCFLLTVEDTSESICDMVKYLAFVSKYNGGYGLDLSRLRHSAIGDVGTSNGLLNWMKGYDAFTKAFNQTGKRPGAGTLSCRPHHIDIETFVEARSSEGSHSKRIFTAGTSIWTSWLFWHRVRNNGDWAMFCPNQTKGLNDVYGFEFEARYLKYEADSSIPRKTIKASKLLQLIVETKRTSGYPYVLNGDAVNMKSNQKHLGYIRCSNLCTEIMEYVPDGQIASCNLHSITLARFAKGKLPDGGRITDAFDFQKLAEISRACVDNLNKVIDTNWYPLDGHIIKDYNLETRPLGIGVQGFADAIYTMDLTFESDEVKTLNKMIFACIYFNCVVETINLAARDGPCKAHKGSPMSEGKLQFDLWADEYQLLKERGYIIDALRKEEDDLPLDPLAWGQQPITLCNGHTIKPSWDSVRKALMIFGARNTLLTAIMPTATSAQLQGTCELIEAPQGNIMSRKSKMCSYPVLNKHMWRDLVEINAWNKYTADFIQMDGGSIARLPEFIHQNPSLYPEFDKSKSHNRLQYIVKKYKVMYELSQAMMLKLMADRARYIDQSHSTNIYIADPNDEKVAKVLLYAEALGLKTMMYYLRMKPSVEKPTLTISTEVDKFFNPSGSKEKTINVVCSLGENECISCQ